MVYVGSFDGYPDNLFALNARTGDILWQYETTTGQIQGDGALAVSNGVLYVGTNLGLEALDADDRRTPLERDIIGGCPTHGIQWHGIHRRGRSPRNRRRSGCWYGEGDLELPHRVLPFSLHTSSGQ